MKVLFLANIPSPYRVDFFNELGKYCDLTVIFERRKANNREWKSPDNKNYRSIFLDGFNIGEDTALCFSIYKYLNKRFDKIIIGGYSTPTALLAIFILKAKKLSFYLNCDGGFIKKEGKLKFHLKRRIISSASYWLSSGKEANKYLKYYGAKEKNIYTYPFTSVKEKDILKTPISIEERKKLKEELQISDDKIVIFVGQITYRKGIDFLLEVAQNLFKGISIYIIGGEATEEYNEQIRKYRLNNVKFFKFMDKEYLYKYYQIADLFLFLSREDIWGLVINEAMANGLPVISSDKCIAGLELIKNNGYIVELNDIEYVSNIINKIVYDYSLLSEFAKNSLKIISKYTIENMASCVYDILDTTDTLDSDKY